MKRQLITASIMAVCLCLGNMSKADMITLYPTDDAYVHSDGPDNTHNDDHLIVQYEYWTTKVRSYFKFNLSDIPAGQSINSASLRISTTSVNYDPTVGVYPLYNDNWSESTITWNNAPTNFNPTATDTQLIDHGGIFFWSVTEDVNDAYNDDGIYSVVMKLINESSEGSEGYMMFPSKDYFDSSRWPSLIIEYQTIPEPATLVLLGLGGLILRKRKL